MVSNNYLIPLSYFALVSLKIALCSFAYYWASGTETAWLRRSILLPTMATNKFSGPLSLSSSIHILRPSKDYRLETSYTTSATRASL